MSKMVERAAAAAFHAYLGGAPSWWIGIEEGAPYDWRQEADLTSTGSEGFLECARAAIAAMREPTPEMIEAAYYSALDENAAGVWRDMIDEALK